MGLGRLKRRRGELSSVGVGSRVGNRGLTVYQDCKKFEKFSILTSREPVDAGDV
jgi:hypothetical protein